MGDLPGLDRPFVGAPMAGGPSTPELAAAVCAAGGLGQLAGAYLSVQQLRARIARTRELTSRPFGVNLFVPTDTTPDAGPEVERYAALLRPEAERHGVALPEPDWQDVDHWQDKLALLLAEPVAVVSFHFGCPPESVVQRLHDVGTRVLVSATTPDEAVAAQAVGADAVCLQAATAGGHRGTHAVSATPNDLDAPSLLAAARPAVSVPLVVAGGITGREQVRAVLDAGAAAVQVGTALLRTPESGTSPVHREALVSGELPGTVVTRAFTGRPARVLRNRFVDRFGDRAPAAFPVVGQLTAGLRARAASAGDVQGMALYAGTGHRHARREPAGEVVRDLSA
jgi:nitronate monooxygenase